MRFPWSRAGASTGSLDGPAPDAAADAVQKCPGLAKILEKIRRIDRPEILDLGPFCGASAVFLADRGARVSVEEFSPPAEPPPEPPRKTTAGALTRPEPRPAPAPIRLDQPDGKFHVVLVWEACDFIPTARLAEFGAEIGRVLADGGWALLLSISSAQAQGVPSRPPRYRVVDADRVERVAVDGPALRRYVHNPRDIERALAPLGVQGIQLQRNQLREFVLLKRGAPA